MISKVTLLGSLTLASLACITPKPATSLAELNRSWVGRPWVTYAETNGNPQKMVTRTNGGQVAVYSKERTETSASSRSQAVDVHTGERRILGSGASPDAARQQFGSNAQVAIQKESPISFRFTCMTLVYVDAKGLIEKIERNGNDCG